MRAGAVYRPSTVALALISPTTLALRLEVVNASSHARHDSRTADNYHLQASNPRRLPLDDALVSWCAGFTC